MTTLFSSATMTPDDGIVVALHLSIEDAYESLRVNFADEVKPGSVDEIVEELAAQDLLFEVTMHDVDLSDIRAEFPDAEQLHKTVYDVVDSHAYIPATADHPVVACMCGWTAGGGVAYGDHVTQAILAALHIPTT